MKIGSRPLLVLHPNQRFVERVRAAAGKAYEVQALPDWIALIDTIREAPASALVLVDPFDETGPRGIAQGLNDLMLHYPSTPVVAAIEVSPGSADALTLLGKKGIVEIVCIGHDDTPEALRRRFHHAQGRLLKALMETVLPVDMPGRGRSILDAAAQIVSEGGHGRDLARMLGLSRRTLLRWTEVASLPPPRRLLAWTRILQAATLLDDPGRTVLSVAHACGYSSDGGLRRVTTKLLGANPTEMRERGAFAGASKGFLAELERHRTHVPGTTSASPIGAGDSQPRGGGDQRPHL